MTSYFKRGKAREFIQDASDEMLLALSVSYDGHAASHHDDKAVKSLAGAAMQLGHVLAFWDEDEGRFYNAADNTPLFQPVKAAAE